MLEQMLYENLLGVACLRFLGQMFGGCFWLVSSHCSLVFCFDIFGVDLFESLHMACSNIAAISESYTKILFVKKIVTYITCEGVFVTQCR